MKEELRGQIKGVLERAALFCKTGVCLPVNHYCGEILVLPALKHVLALLERAEGYELAVVDRHAEKPKNPYSATWSSYQDECREHRAYKRAQQDMTGYVKEVSTCQLCGKPSDGVCQECADYEAVKDALKDQESAWDVGWDERS